MADANLPTYAVGYGSAGNDPFYTWFEAIRRAQGGAQMGGGFGPGMGGGDYGVGPVGTGAPPGAFAGTPITGVGPATPGWTPGVGVSVLPSSGVPATTQAMAPLATPTASSASSAPAWLKFLDKYKEPIAQGIAGLGDYLSGRTASNAAKDAAAIQAAAGERALGEVKGAYSPYMNVGQSAITTLGALSGLPVGGGGPMAASAAPTLGTASQRPSAQEVAWYANLVGPDGTPRSRQPNTPPSRDVQTAGMAQTASGYAPGTAPMGQGQMVRVQAPDGRVVLVPRPMVPQAVQQGGTVVGPATGRA